MSEHVTKNNGLSLSVKANETLKKIKVYKQNKNQKLRDEIIADNIGLVYYVAHRYALATGINQEELESYGSEALLIALENFDISLGYDFSTYAVACISKKILTGIKEILSDKKSNFYWDYVRAKKIIENDHGKSLAESPELVEKVIDLLVETGKIKEDYESKKIARMRINALVMGNVSLDDEEVLEELINDGQLIDTHDYAEEVLNSMSKEVIEKMLDTLNYREAKVIKLRFGLDDGKPKSLEEVGKMLGVSQSRIRQIEGNAFRKLRDPSITEYLRDYYEDSETEKYGR